MVITGEHTYELSATEITNIDGFTPYLWDKYNDTYFDLSMNEYYDFTSEAGTYTDRFSIVFQTQETLSEETIEPITDTLIYFNTKDDKIYIKGLNQNSKNINLIDMSGKTIYQFGEQSSNQMNEGLPITNISSGIYLVSVVTDTNQLINKKLIID